MFLLVAALSMLVPFAGFFLTIAYFNQYKRPISSALLCGLVFSAAMYGYIPDEGNDIFRHMENMLYYEGIPLWDAFDLLKTDISHISAVYTWDLWLWLVAQFGTPELLQSSGAFVGYSITSYMVFDYACINKLPLKKWFPLLLAFLAFTSPTNLAIGIRNGNAFLICILAFYRFYIKNAGKISTALLLLTAFFLHHSVIIILGLWLAFPFLIRFRFLSLIMIVIGLATFSNYENYLYLLTGGSTDTSGIISSTMYSATAYKNADFNNSAHAVVDLIWRLWGAGFLLWLSKKTISSFHKATDDIKLQWEYRFFYLALLLYVISVTLVPLIGNNGMRFINAVYLLCLIILMRKDSFPLLSRNGTFHISTILLVLTCLGNVVFYAYNMNWGTGSFMSFIWGSLLGYTARILLYLP